MQQDVYRPSFKKSKTWVVRTTFKNDLQVLLNELEDVGYVIFSIMPSPESLDKVYRIVAYKEY